MDFRVIEYLVYTPVSVLLTVWVATTLFRHGRRFLIDVFRGDQGLADSVNHLLVVGFYLVNLGYVSLQLKLATAPGSAGEIIEALAGKVGLVLIVLGLMHFGNLFVFTRLRQRSRRTRQQPRRPPVAQAPPPAPPLPLGTYGGSGFQPESGRAG
jgi:hypothetical protein